MSTNSNSRLSFEFFPPKTEAGTKKLLEEQKKLATQNPAFYSVTYGAGGSTRENTRNIVMALRQRGAEVAPHLSFGDDGDETLLSLLQEYQSAGVTRIVALRGDTPSGSGAKKLVYANELVNFIRQQTGNHFELEVAAYPEIHPEAESYEKDLFFLKKKLDSGANSAITQYFFNADAYFYFLDECQKSGIDKPIYPGIMPITNFNNLARFSQNCGAEIPRWLTQKIADYKDDPVSIEQYGIEFVSKLCEKLLDGGVPGLHFYTMNRAEPTLTICENIGLKP